MEVLPYKIANLKLAEWGRLEMEMSEQEMPGLMELRKEYKDSKPLKGARICGCVSMTIQTAVFIETLKFLGADIRWSSCSIYATQDHAAAAVVDANSAAVFAWKGQTVEEYWWSIYQTFLWGDNQTANLIVDDGGDLTGFLHDGAQAEIEFEKSGKLPDPSIIEGTDRDHQEMMIVLAKIIPESKGIFRRTIKNIVGRVDDIRYSKTRKIGKKKRIGYSSN